MARKPNYGWEKRQKELRKKKKKDAKLARKQAKRRGPEGEFETEDGLAPGEGGEVPPASAVD